MIKRLLGICAALLLVLILGARLGAWRGEGVSLVGEGDAAVAWGGWK